MDGGMGGGGMGGMGGSGMGGGGMGGGGGTNNPLEAAISTQPDYSPSKIFVGGIPHSVDEQTFAMYFSQFGEIVESWLMYDQTNSRPRGFGFVVFSTSQAMEATIQR